MRTRGTNTHFEHIKNTDAFHRLVLKLSKITHYFKLALMTITYSFVIKTARLSYYVKWHNSCLIGHEFNKIETKLNT